MYCPECGVKLKEHENICPRCGRDLYALHEMGRKNLKKLIIIIIGVICAPIIIIATYLYLDMAAIYLSLVILAVAFILYHFYPTTNENEALISKCCPNCYNMYFNQDFCFKCGYDLRELYGFSTWTGYDLEIREKHIQISRYYLNHGRRKYICTSKYATMHIRNLHINYNQCGRFLSRLPCLVFEYNPLYIDTEGTFKITILKKLLSQMEEAILDPVFRQARSNEPYPVKDTLQMDYKQ